MGDDRAPNFGGEEPANPPAADDLGPTARELRNRSLRNLPPVRPDGDRGDTGSADDPGTSDAAGSAP
jgi:hypothetical protein